MHALIIEEQAFIGCMIEDALRESGFTSFDFACTVEDAVAAAARRCPDLITTDIRIGRGSGIEAIERICEAIERICLDKPIPVLFITATPGRIRERIDDAVVVQKPFSVGELRMAVVGVMAAS